MLRYPRGKGNDERNIYFTRDQFYKDKNSFKKDSKKLSNNDVLEKDKFNGENFRIGLPYGWGYRVVYTIFGPQQEGREQTIQITQEKGAKSRSAEDLARAQINILKEHLSNCKIIHETSMNLINNVEAFYVFLTWFFRMYLPSFITLSYLWYLTELNIPYRLLFQAEKKNRKFCQLLRV